ncbi:helix-turn-helix transcriptional regulator [Glaciibacter flavus]|uniref:Helix-turn-helix transcriptional regulator n=1 Tax=Orlajensenia flava TaxID=2565934 RepID=A0A4S4FVX6_9MICO|nr:DUF5937 family protein [Glaciibacter flavus]THG34498.1 helix-turn-helix transcriptional regulator [Glaciibacter flavus]
MVSYQLTDADLGGVRFGLSPLCELGLSLRAIKDPSRFPLQLPWLRRTEDARALLDTPTLMALIDERFWTPEFLNPRPTSPLTRIDDEFAVLSRTRTSIFLRDLDALHGGIPPALLGDPRLALRRVVDALRALWDSCFAPYWPRMRTVLEADVAYRGRQIAQSGLGPMLNGLSETVSFSGDLVSVRLASASERLQRTDGQGLTLVPTMFTRRGSAPVGDGPPMIMYPARGQGALWETERVASPAAVEGVLGRVRTSLLTALAEPATSTELGVRFDVTTSAVNQHLRALRDAGLLTSTRYGRSVLYFRSELGSSLLGAGHRSDAHHGRTA